MRFFKIYNVTCNVIKTEDNFCIRLDDDTFVCHDTVTKDGIKAGMGKIQFGDSSLSIQDKTRQIQDCARLFRKQLLHTGQLICKTFPEGKMLCGMIIAF